MRTALDSSVLLSILKRQAGWEKWRDSLARASTEGLLIMCPIVFAECSAGFPSVTTALNRFEGLRIYYDAILPDAAYVAGQAFVQYRQNGGPRIHLIPDFLVAAHALTQADRLAAIDRGYLRRYFASLRLL